LGGCFQSFSVIRKKEGWPEMNYRTIWCECGEIIGHYPVFSHQYDEQDTGAAEYNGMYGGTVDGYDYCVNCYDRAVHEMRELDEEEACLLNGAN
jgi:hypothetical protein